jgi:hypothetical protein
MELQKTDLFNCRDVLKTQSCRFYLFLIKIGAKICKSVTTLTHTESTLVVLVRGALTATAFAAMLKNVNYQTDGLERLSTVLTLIVNRKVNLPGGVLFVTRSIWNMNVVLSQILAKACLQKTLHSMTRRFARGENKYVPVVLFTQRIQAVTPFIVQDVDVVVISALVVVQKLVVDTPLHT